MALKDYVYSLLSNDEELNDMGIDGDHIFLQHTADTEQVRPLVILRWQAVSPGFTSGDGSPLNRQVLQVWVHDKPSSYARVIDPALIRLRTILTALTGVNVGGPHEWLSACVWEGDSEHLDDDAVGTIVRNAQFRFTGSGI